MSSLNYVKDFINLWKCIEYSYIVRTNKNVSGVFIMFKEDDKKVWDRFSPSWGLNLVGKEMVQIYKNLKQ